ncbi:MAG: aspartate carbamoyltransferase [Thaumarchaeota archaeon]|nr:aspartate carbamoyltransferase [Candidatus Terraquivivens yellowstonensis]
MWKFRDVISILDFTRDDLEHLFSVTDRIIERPLDIGKPLDGKIVATAFIEPSTRTRLSFETAAKRLGAEVINLEPHLSSMAKGESLTDTMRMLDDYANLIVIRSPYEGSAKHAADVCENPVINGGDGTQHHPTQAMIDLYTIRRLKGRIDGLEVGVVGDLKYGRAAASFIYGLTKFNVKKIWLVSPEPLSPRPELMDRLKRMNVEIVKTENLESAVENVDILYVTRIQKERFPDPAEYEKLRGSYVITRKLLSRAREDLKVLHPLPRVDELSNDVDDTPHQAYFIQAKLGVPVRMALIGLVLGVF